VSLGIGGEPLLEALKVTINDGSAVTILI